MGRKVAIICLMVLLLVAGCIQVQENGSRNESHFPVSPTMRTCSGKTTDCQGDCVNLESNVNNCGTCGHACPTGLYCTKGECVLRLVCLENQTQCSSYYCSDLNTSSFDCGACGIKCSFDLPVQTCCNGTCKSLQTDPDNCGICGLQCSPSEVCCAGICVNSGNNPCKCEPECPEELTCCNNSCMNLMTNTDNCGRCGNACTSPNFCQGGMCVHLIP
jgi:hypothetical protein